MKKLIILAVLWIFINALVIYLTIFWFGWKMLVILILQGLAVYLAREEVKYGEVIQTNKAIRNYINSMNEDEYQKHLNEQIINNLTKIEEDE